MFGGTIFLIVIAFVLVLSVLFHHYVQQQQIYNADEREAVFVRQALQNITSASTPTDKAGDADLMVSLRQLWESRSVLENLVARRGHDKANELCGKDVKQLLRTVDGMDYELQSALSSRYEELFKENVLGSIGTLVPVQDVYEQDDKQRSPDWYSSDDDSDSD